MDERENNTRILKFEFHGQAEEFFRIWIVNLLLSIITLGIYSAWAKVRTNRYFYSNMQLDGTGFQYLANPVQILTGRIVAVLVFGTFALFAESFPIISASIISGVFIFLTPLLMNLARAFSNRMTAWRNIRFRFEGNYWKAFTINILNILAGAALTVVLTMIVLGFMVFYPEFSGYAGWLRIVGMWIGQSVLLVLTLGLLLPYAVMLFHKYTVERSAFGTQAFSFTASYRDYAKIFLQLTAVLSAAGYALATIYHINSALGIVGIVLVCLSLPYTGMAVYAELIKLYYRELGLGENRFESTVTAAGLHNVLLLNTFLTLITLGLYFPVLKIRVVRYLSDHLVMKSTGSLDNFTAAENENVSALGEELAAELGF